MFSTNLIYLIEFPSLVVETLVSIRFSRRALTTLWTRIQIKRKILNCRHDLNGYIRELRIKEVAKQHYAKLNFSEEPVDWKNIVADFIMDYEKLNQSGVDKTKEGVVDRNQLLGCFFCTRRYGPCG